MIFDSKSTTFTSTTIFLLKIHKQMAEQTWVLDLKGLSYVFKNHDFDDNKNMILTQQHDFDVKT